MRKPRQEGRHPLAGLSREGESPFPRPGRGRDGSRTPRFAGRRPASQAARPRIQLCPPGRLVSGHPLVRSRVASALPRSKGQGRCSGVRQVQPYRRGGPGSVPPGSARADSFTLRSPCGTCSRSSPGGTPPMPRVPAHRLFLAKYGVVSPGRARQGGGLLACSAPVRCLSGPAGLAPLASRAPCALPDISKATGELDSCQEGIWSEHAPVRRCAGGAAALPSRGPLPISWPLRRP